jgi:hypothetical protein
MKHIAACFVLGGRYRHAYLCTTVDTTAWCWHMKHIAACFVLGSGPGHVIAIMYMHNIGDYVRRALPLPRFL